MVLHLTEADVKALLPMDECIDVLDELFRQEAAGQVENMLTQEFAPPQGFFRLKSGAIWSQNTVGFKIYGGGRNRRMIFLWDHAEGLAGIVDSVALTQIRTGALSGLATRYMARPEATTVGIIGTGKEARTQLEAMAAVRPIRGARAFSRNPDNREKYADEMAEKLGFAVEPVDSGEECVKDVDIVITATGANQPVLEGKWLAAGAHINAIGATTLFRRELDEEAITRSSTVVVEHLATAEAECGELIWAATRAKLRWSQVRELKDIVMGDIPGRRSADEITLFDSIGVGAEDVAVAIHLIERAKARGVGREVDL